MFFKNNISLFVIIVIAMIIGSHQAQAVSKRVSSPNVSKGLAADARGSFSHDNEDENDFRHNFQLKYGFNDKFRISADTDFRKTAGEEGEFTNTDLEFRYNFFRNDAFATAFSGGYEFNHLGDSDALFTSLQAQYKAGKWKHQANFGVDKEVGDESGDGFDYDFRSGHYYNLEKVELGVEYFADFGNSEDSDSFNEQEHHLGPVINFDIPVGKKKVKAVLGYAAGLTDASENHILKYEFGYKF